MLLRTRHLSFLASVAVFWLAVPTFAFSQALPAAPGRASFQRPVPARPVPARPAATIGGQRRPLTSKPFSNHVQRSPVSPYMNLFRTNNAGGTIDNYSTLVKPMLQQQRMNQTIARNNRRLNAVEPSLSRSEDNIDRIRRQTQVLEGRAPTSRTSSRFMNSGGRFGQR